MTTLHTIRVRVYYEDTDAGGIVYYANYLKFFERARTDWLRALGVEQRILAEQGLIFVVRECALRFDRPARLDDELLVAVAIAEPATDVKRVSLRLAQQAQRAGDGALLAAGSVRIACVEPRSGRPAAMPGWLIERIDGAVAAASAESSPRAS
ncbi:MAG: tol-pal system-associated acyl-CoA thioesterase [Lautropia sp.]